MLIHQSPLLRCIFKQTLEIVRCPCAVLFLLSQFTDPSRDGRGSVTRLLLRGVAVGREMLCNSCFRLPLALGELDDSNPLVHVLYIPCLFQIHLTPDKPS